MRHADDTELFRLALGGRVRERRKELRLSLDGLAARTALSKTGLCEIETGKTIPGAGTLWRLSRALGMSIDWIVKGDES